MSEKRTRDQIVDAADRLFYRRGFAHTSFSDIADVVHISRGNFYHHFKSKDEILAAVIEKRQGDARDLLSQWQADRAGPNERIRCYIDILVRNGGQIKRYGCPVGMLCAELARLQHASRAEANALFGLFRSWLCAEFIRLGCASDADALALHLIARSQGIAMMANTLGDPHFVRREVEELYAWLAQVVARSSGAAATADHEQDPRASAGQSRKVSGKAPVAGSEV